MTTIVITRDNTGKLVGFGEKDKKAYAAFQRRIKELEPGEIYRLTVWFPRNQKLHGLHFVMISAVFEQQEQFDDADKLREWLYVGAGFCDFLPGPSGRMVAIAKSVAWDKTDDQDFSEVHGKVIDFLRTPHATRFLWPHLSDPEQAEMADSILSQFQRSE